MHARTNVHNIVEQGAKDVVWLHGQGQALPLPYTDVLRCQRNAVMVGATLAVARVGPPLLTLMPMGLVPARVRSQPVL